MVCGSKSYKAAVSFTDSSHWQDNAVLGVCADRHVPSELCVWHWPDHWVGAESRPQETQSIGSGCSHVEWQYLAHCSSGSSLWHPEFLFLTSPPTDSLAVLSLMSWNSVFPPGGNEGNSFVLGFWDYLDPFNPIKVECLILIVTVLYLLQEQELHFIFVLQMRAIRRHWLLCSLLDTASLGWNHLRTPEVGEDDAEYHETFNMKALMCDFSQSVQRKLNVSSTCCCWVK